MEKSKVRAQRKSQKLTVTKVYSYPAPDPSGKDKIYWDSELKGFGVRVSGKTNTKSYIVQRDINKVSRRITISQTNLISLAEARKRGTKIIVAMADGIDPKAKVKQDRSQTITLKEALESYFETKKDLRENTKYDYEKTIHRYFKDWLDRPLKNIDRDMAIERHKDIQKQVENNGRSSLVKGHHAANSAMVTLRLLWNHASVLTPGLPENPVSGLSQLRAWFKEKRRERVLRASDLPRFFEAALEIENRFQRDLVLLLLFTGLRSQEARTLRWEDIDFTDQLIRIPSTRTKSGRKLDLPMSDFIEKLLKNGRAIGNTGPWVFPSNSKSGHIIEAKYPFELIEKKTRIHITPHDLRRTFITIAESCDIPTYALKGLVNHSMGDDVTAGYVIASPDRLRKPMQKVTNKLKELIGI